MEAKDREQNGVAIMSDSYGNVTVTSSVTQIIANLTQRRSIILRNNGTAIVYIGFDNAVASSTGFPLLPQDSIELSGLFTTRKPAIYGISASGSQDIRYLSWDA